MADAATVAEVLGVEESKLGSIVTEALYKDGEGPLGDLVDKVNDVEKKVKDLSDAVEYQKSEAKKAYDVRDQVKQKLRELEANGIKDDEMKVKYQEANKSLATLEAEKVKTCEELENLRKFKTNTEENNKAQIESAIKQHKVPKQIAEMIRRMDLSDQMLFIQNTYANPGVNDKTPFAGKKISDKGAPFEGFISEDDYEKNKKDKSWVKENREKLNKSMEHWK